MIASHTLYSACRHVVFPFTALILLCVAPSIRGQSVSMDECSGGTLYYISFPDTVTNAWDDRFPAQLIRTNTTAYNLYIYSPVDQIVNVGRMHGAGMKVSVEGGKIRELDLKTLGVLIATNINTPQTNVIALRSDFPVIVYAYMLTPFGAEAFTPIPVESWGIEYYAGTWAGEIVRDVHSDGEYAYRTIPREAPSQILIIAAYDNTQVRISPKAPLKNCAGCQNVTLKSGEAYLVQASVDTSAHVERQTDLGGSFIQASKPIGVISGNTRVMHNSGVRPALAENSLRNLAVEWITPVDQHGTEFVFTPTWDDRRQREGLDPEESRSAELVRIFGTSIDNQETEIHWKDSLGRDIPAVTTPINSREFTHERIGTPIARAFRTSRPAMAIASPLAVVKFNGTTTWGPNYAGASYLSWSTFTTELVPREQWTSFAPLRVPSLPTSMTHYLNLVADSTDQFDIYLRQGSSPRQSFPFNRGSVPGTKFAWGSIQLIKGVDYIIEGDNGARFTGHVYGSYRGQEQFRPGRAKEDESKGSSISGAESAQVMHPCEYEEDVALMYGYPLAPSRCLSVSPDEYNVKLSQHCDVMLIEMNALNNPASGLRSITLLPDSSENVRLEFIEPANAGDIQSGKVTEVKLRLVAINPLRDAHGILIVRDRTRASTSWRIPYRWRPERASLGPDTVLDFGEVTLNTPAGERMVTISNPLAKDIVVKRLSLLLDTEGFEITRTDQSFNWRDNIDSVTLSPGESLKVWVNVIARREGVSEDSLQIHSGCITQSILLRAGAMLPCLFIDDLDFGTMNVGETRSLDFKICNMGRGSVRPNDPWLTWLQSQASEMGFDVDQSEIDKLIAGGTLGKDECITLQVRFTGTDPGYHRTTARLWADTRLCRDTSIWRAHVVERGPQIGSFNWGERWVSENPCTKNSVDGYNAVIDVKNAGTAPFEVVSLTIEGDGDAVFAVQSTDIAPGLIMQPSDVRTIQVFFDPREEKVYNSSICLTCKMRIGDRDSVFKICAPLEGIGIESYVTVSDADFGRVEYAEAGSVSIPGSVIITAEGTRPVSIDKASINLGTHFEFAPMWAASNPWVTAGGSVLQLDPQGIDYPKSLTVDLLFVPKSNEKPEMRATLDLIGDFAYDHCSQTDSSGLLLGQIYVHGAEATGPDFGTILNCYGRDGFISVRNEGTEPLTISAISVVTPAGMATNFTVNVAGATVALPYIIAPGDSALIPVRFTPNDPGPYNASVDITLMNEDQTKEVAVLSAPLNGIAVTHAASMSIARDHHGTPGTAVQIPITLNDELDAAQVDELSIKIEYHGDLLSLDEIELGDLFPADEGWHLEILEKTPGRLRVRIINDLKRFLSGTGDILDLKFIPLKGERKETEIVFSVSPMGSEEDLGSCIAVTTYPGHFTIDSDTQDPDDVSLLDITPNPLKNGATIAFGIGKKSDVEIAVYTSDGRRVALLLDEERERGIYEIEWDATDLITGAYYVQIKAGDKIDSKAVRVWK